MRKTAHTTPQAEFQARQLRIAPVTFLTRLYRLGEFNVIVRADGATLLKKTRFGMFLAEEDGSLLDPVSGLRIVPGQIERICLIMEPGSSPFFEIEFSDGEFSLAIRPSGSLAEIEKADCLLRSFRHDKLISSDIRQRGAGAWLDENLSTRSCANWRNHFAVSRGNLPVLNTTLASAALSLTCQLKVSACDREKNVWHFSDTSSGSVIYLDLSHPDIELGGFSSAYHRKQSFPAIPHFDLN